MKDDKIGAMEASASDLDQTMSALEEAKSVNSDDALLMSMGKKPELRRVYNFWTRQYLTTQCPCMTYSWGLKQCAPTRS
jgi:3-dehydroquinate dehydratase